MVHSNVEMYSFGLFGICFILGQSNLANPDLQETDRRWRGRGDVRLFVSFPFTPDASFILPPIPPGPDDQIRNWEQQDPRHKSEEEGGPTNFPLSPHSEEKRDWGRRRNESG